MKKYLLAAIFTFPLLIFPTLSFAKVLPQALKSAPVKSSGPAVASIGISARLRADRRALLVNFSGLQNARTVSYSLIYNTSEQQEGAVGSVNLADGKLSESEELLFLGPVPKESVHTIEG